MLFMSWLNQLYRYSLTAKQKLSNANIIRLFKVNTDIFMLN